MSTGTRISLQKDQDRFGPFGRMIWSGILMALPLAGLVLFFETTQPASVISTGGVAAQVASGPAELSGATGRWISRERKAVARFSGVSAERRASKAEPVAQVIASDAGDVLARAPFGSLKPGFYTEFLSKDRHRIALLIVNRERIMDRAIPDNERLMSVAEASTANAMSFAWGGWIYKVEIEDKGVEPEGVVQKVL